MGGDPRVSAGSRDRGLLALYLLTDVEPAGAPTRLRPGSHRDVPPILAPAGEEGMAWLPAAQQAARASAHRPTALATGRAGGDAAPGAAGHPRQPARGQLTRRTLSSRELTSRR